jgi:preprotein translocase subunit SecG
VITLVTILHIFVCVVLILVILLQAGKGGGMGAAFGGSSQTVFGGRGAQTFLGKVTSACAALFMLTSLTLAYHASHGSSVVRAESAAPEKQKGPPESPPAPAGTSSKAQGSAQQPAPAPKK